MDLLSKFTDDLVTLAPASLAVALVVLTLFTVHYILRKRYSGTQGHQFRMQLAMLILSFIGLLIVILALPVSETTTGGLLSLIGLLLSAAIALSSTTFVGNIMAGFMLRAVRAFRIGDYIRVGDCFGRVTEQGLFHVEIQTEDRDLTTMPNLHLVTHPVKVIRSSGTFVTTEVSLGYDVHHAVIKEALLEAASDAELEEPFVQILELGDFSVTYRVAGLLTETKKLLSVRSRLKRKVLDRLHDRRIEIVSPNFMNQRVLKDEQVFVPKPVSPTEEGEDKASPEGTVFDKAEAAESLEQLRLKYEQLRSVTDEKKARLSSVQTESERASLTREVKSAEERLSILEKLILRAENRI